MEWTFEGLHIAPDRWQYPARLGQDLQKALYALNQYLVFGAVEPTTRIHNPEICKG